MAAPRSAHAFFAFGVAIPIGLLGGLIGLGGAEFRLPVLVGRLRYGARQAVALNLSVSLVTVTFSLIGRARALPFEQLAPYQSAVLALCASAVVAAYAGTLLIHRLSNHRLDQVILVFLVVIGAALIVEGFLPGNVPALLSPTLLWQVGAGLIFGLAIGIVSSLLGVAGGELIIPTLVFAYGMDIKLAGTASLLISLPTVLVGVLRYARSGAYRERWDWSQTIGPMALGSVLGALGGSLLVGLVPQVWLKVGLGNILLISAWRTFRKSSPAH